MNYENKGPSNEALKNIIGESLPVIQMVQQIRRVAPLDHTVLINGETGCGKELVARALHNTSSRAHAPFAVINCAALPPPLFESELFGHEKGAFTGAHELYRGVFEQAQGGTLFLDEIGELPLAFQPKLLRVLENRTIRRVGGKQEIPIDVRIIAATHQDLFDLVQQNKFREDLFYRLHIIPIQVPSLKERIDDIPLLANHFVAELSSNAKKLSVKAIEKLMGHHWPGNIRELKNVISRSVSGSEDPIVSDKDIHIMPSSFKLTYPVLHLKTIEKQAILQAIDRAKGNVFQASQLLGISYASLRRKLSDLKS